MKNTLNFLLFVAICLVLLTLGYVAGTNEKQAAIQDAVDKCESTIIDSFYDREAANAEGYFPDYANERTVYLYPQALPYSTDKNNFDTLVCWMQNDTLIIVPQNL